MRQFVIDNFVKILKIGHVRKPLLTNFEAAVWFSMTETYNLFFGKICRTDEFRKYPFLCKTDLRNVYGFEIRVYYSWQNLLNVLRSQKKLGHIFLSNRPSDSFIHIDINSANICSNICCRAHLLYCVLKKYNYEKKTFSSHFSPPFR